jgi:hypothetical protein
VIHRQIFAVDSRVWTRECGINHMAVPCNFVPAAWFRDVLHSEKCTRGGDEMI